MSSPGRASSPGEDVDEFVVDDLDDLLARGHRLGDSLTRRLVLHALDEVAGDRQRDVGLEQGDAHLSQGRPDVVIGERALLRQPVEDAGESF